MILVTFTDGWFSYGRQRKLSPAIEHYHAALSIKQDSGVVYNNLGVSYYLDGEFGKAKDAFISGIEKGEEGSRVFNNLVVALGKLGEV